MANSSVLDVVLGNKTPGQVAAEGVKDALPSRWKLTVGGFLGIVVVSGVAAFVAYWAWTYAAKLDQKRG